MSIDGSPEHWLQRAEEVRTAAEGMRDAEARAAMLRVAENYEMIAKRAEARELGIGITEHHRLSA